VTILFLLFACTTMLSGQDEGGAVSVEETTERGGDKGLELSLPVPQSSVLPPEVEPQVRIATRPTATAPQTFRTVHEEDEGSNWAITHSHASAFAVHGATGLRLTLWESEDASDYKDYSMEGRLVSVVGNVVSFEIMEGGHREGAAHGFAIHQFGAVMLDWGFGDKVQGVPLKWLLQDEIECLENSGFYEDISEDDMDMAIKALCESPQMEAPLRAVIEAAPPLRDMPEKDRGCTFQEEALTGTSYAFHQLEGDQVIVHLGLGHGCEVLRGAFTEVLFGYKPPEGLMKELRQAEKRGLLGHQLRPAEGRDVEQERNQATNVRKRVPAVPWHPDDPSLQLATWCKDQPEAEGVWAPLDDGTQEGCVVPWAEASGAYTQGAKGWIDLDQNEMWECSGLIGAVEKAATVHPEKLYVRVAGLDTETTRAIQVRVRNVAGESAEGEYRHRGFDPWRTVLLTDGIGKEGGVTSVPMSEVLKGSDHAVQVQIEIYGTAGEPVGTVVRELDIIWPVSC
jgi:hypothetical protein